MTTKAGTLQKALPTRFEFAALMLGLAMFLVLAFSIAETKLLWYDEIFTRGVIDRGSWTKILAGLHRGLDQQPPLFFLLTKWARALGGEPVGLRLPAIFGFALSGLSLYLLARRWLSHGYAIVAMTVPGIGWFASLGVEARPYGLLLGLVSLALLGWTYRDRFPLAGRAGYIIGMLCAGAIHYYGFLASVPFCVAVVWTAFRTRHWNFWTILGCGCAFLPNFLSLSLIRDSIAIYKMGAWNPPSWSALLLSSYSWAIAGLAAAFLLSRNWKRQAESPSMVPPDVVPGSETLACWTGFCAIPIIAVFLAKSVSGMIVPRYYSMYSIGYGLLLAYLLERTAVGSRRLGYLAAGVALIIFLSSAITQYQAATLERANVLASITELEGILRRPEFCKSRLLIGSPLTALQFAYYSPKLRARMVVPVDPVLSSRYLGNDSAQKDLLSLRGNFPLDIEPLNEFLHHEKQKFLAYHSFGSFLGMYLSEEKEFPVRLQVVMQDDAFVLLQVDPLAVSGT